MKAIVFEGDKGVAICWAAPGAQRPDVTEYEAIYTTQQQPGPPDANGNPTLVDVQVQTGIQTVVDVPAETEAEFLTRLVSEAVPAGARHIIVSDVALLPATPPEHWAVDWDAGTISPGGVPKAELLAYAAEKRWRVASGGITVPLPGGGSIAVPSDDIAYGRLKGAYQDLVSGIITEPITIVIGATVMTANQALVQALYAAISQHWQACYAIQGTLVTGINAGTVTTIQEIDAALG